MIKKFRNQWSYTVWRLRVNLRMSSPTFSSFTWCVIWTDLRSMGSFHWTLVREDDFNMGWWRPRCHKASNMAVRILQDDPRCVFRIKSILLSTTLVRRWILDDTCTMLYDVVRTLHFPTCVMLCATHTCNPQTRRSMSRVSSIEGLIQSFEGFSFNHSNTLAEEPEKKGKVYWLYS